MDKVKLSVLGLSYSETQSGAYALVLAEEEGERRIPIIIGAFEAQAIAIELEGLKPPRPLTHDLFLHLANSFKIKLKEVNIFKLEEGVFYSNLILIYEKSETIIDSRTSDAIALALRFKCPIYTTKEVIDKSGIIIEFSKDSENDKDLSNDIQFNKSNEKLKSGKSIFSKYTLKELETMLQDAISNEDYEKASSIRDEISGRKKE